jgi:hypothetical protein
MTEAIIPELEDKVRIIYKLFPAWSWEEYESCSCWYASHLFWDLKQEKDFIYD